MSVVNRQFAILIVVGTVDISDRDASADVTAPRLQHWKQSSDPVAGDAMRCHLREHADVVSEAGDAFSVVVDAVGVDEGGHGDQLSNGA